MISTKKLYLFFAIALYCFCFCFPCFAEKTGKMQGDLSTVNAKLKKINFPSELVSMEPSPLHNFYLAYTKDGSVYYISENLRYLFLGNIVDLNAKDMEQGNITEASKAKFRKDNINQLLSSANAISYKPKGAVKTKIFVFTNFFPNNILFHKELNNILDSGIEVNYLGFSTGGETSPEFIRMASIWCNGNPYEFVEEVLSKKEIEINYCDNNPLQKHLEIARRFEVYSTPTIIFENGYKKRGRLSAGDLIKLAMENKA